ncbi:MAG: 2-hydroxyacyl-CoA dehydratase [Candidatus Neomarinimicrobiota bacterium]|nr:MAG: 2-hydroxyacyl-CoA dehydratase [Candidatus Neomarinimicrobiota bacterium]
MEEITQGHLDDVVAQFEHLIAVGEEVIGSPLQNDRLVEVLELSSAATRLWKQVLETARRRPAPLTFFDGTILMAPIVVLRGTPECVTFYQDTLAELTREETPGAVPDEEVRLYWEGMPIWGRLRRLAEFFRENQTAVVASTYCNSWVFDAFDPQRPLESMAHAYTQIFINRGERTKVQAMLELMEKFQVDGVVFHDSKTCFNNSNNRFGLPRKLQETSPFATVVIDGDLNDLRFLSEGQMLTKLETFIDQLKARRHATV